jgi:hypothetical protein
MLHPSTNATDRARGSKGMTAILVHDVKQPSTQHISFPRRLCARGLANFPPSLKLWRAGCHLPEGWRSADRRPVLARHRWPAASHKTRVNALMSRCRPGRLRGAPASLAIGTPRLSALHTVAILGLGSAFPPSAFPPKDVQPAPGSTGHSARRAVSEPPEHCGYEPRARDATPCSAFRIVSGDAPQ